jgi:serine/threonine protein kinase
MQMTGGPLERGSVVGGYRIDELIGRGGMGVVYRATHVALGRIYALKVLAPELADDEQFRQRFRREMRIAASLHHPNVVAIHYAGEHEGLLFLVMDFITGTDLHEVMRKSDALDPDRACALLEQLASALDAAHRKGLVHRDVKPENILITVRDGEEHAYLTDFGVAKKFDTVTGVGGLTKKGAVVGTVDYMSPEQISGGHVDARSDIYALGCIFYLMLTGRVPYEREMSVAALFAHVHSPPPTLTGPLAEQYPNFGAVIEKAMAKEPDDRYLSAGDFARDALAALSGVRYTAQPTVVATGEARPTLSGDGAVEPRGPTPEPSEPVPETSVAGADSEPPPAAGVPATDVAATSIAAASVASTDVPTADVLEAGIPVAGVSGTDVPGTAVPLTGVSATDAPGTAVPVTGVSATDAPGTAVPVTGVSATDVPGTAVPVTGIGGTQVPAAGVPVTDAGATRMSATGVPETNVGATDAPPSDAGMTHVPAAGVPVAGVSATHVPATGVPAVDVPPTALSAPTPVATAGGPGGLGPPTRRPGRNRWPALVVLALVCAVGAAVAVVALSSGGSPAGPAVDKFEAVAAPVPTNRVTGSGTATLQLHGDVATVTLNTNGLAPDVHLMHIHGGTGNCPPASAAQVFNGHRFIGATVGQQYYGGVVASLTEAGDTSPAAHLLNNLYPAVGNIRYSRTFTLAPGVATEIRQGLATIIVHGINYDGNARYDNFLGPQAEAAAPALCGPLVPALTAATGTHGSSGTVYMASLAVEGGSPSQQSSSWVYFCHIAGVPVTPPPTAADSRVGSGVIGSGSLTG